MSVRPATIAAVALFAGGLAWWAAASSAEGHGLPLPFAAGLAVAMAILGTCVRPRIAARCIAVTATALATVVMTQARDVPVVLALAAVVGAGLGVVAGRPAAATATGRAGLAVGVVALLTVIVAAGWVGANSSTATWFGAQVAHGDRSRPEVALTFDDGPNDTTTLAVRDVLDRFGARGTFFSVGRAVDARPAISAALVADGHLVENHSYAHDSFRWLDPRYPELQRADAAVRRAVGRCPAFYRPPHGQHTPLLGLVVTRHHMTMIGWDDSAGDWATTDPAVVARRILRKVRPGSIIDLHDGLDGRPGVDRTVLVRAMPLILEGLRARGMRPVGLDELLGRPAYRSCGRTG